jgi:DNA-directed RNA polymerase specialized sigma24 family protein
MLASMELQPAPEKREKLTPEAFASFLAWLSPDQGQAAKDFLEIRKTLVRYFVRKGCSHAEDLTDRTLDRVALISLHEPGKYPKPMPLCCGVARRVWLEYLREAAPAPLEDENIPSPVQYEDHFTDQEINCLGSCLARLSPRDRELITQYHQFQGRQKIEARKQLATLYGGLNKVRITTCRIRARLHDCVTGCVQRSALN